MQFNQDINPHTHIIRTYSKGEVTITLPFTKAESGSPDDKAETENAGGLRLEKLQKSFILLPELLISDWAPQVVGDLADADIEQICDLKPEVVIIGTGERLIWPERALFKSLMSAGIGYEIMDTAAACRTYNILSHEGRKVAAAIMMI